MKLNNLTQFHISIIVTGCHKVMAGEGRPSSPASGGDVPLDQGRTTTNYIVRALAR